MRPGGGRGARLLALAALSALAGCKAIPPIAGLAGGAAAGGATANPAVGFAVGVATDAAVDAGLRYYGRSRQHAEQDAIAAVAGPLPPGGWGLWRIRHTIPIGNEHGELEVVRLIDNPLAPCKEIVFSVTAGQGTKAARAWYTADICREADNWHWASAEPAVPRWGFLQ